MKPKATTLGSVWQDAYVTTKCVLEVHPLKTTSVQHRGLRQVLMSSVHVQFCHMQIHFLISGGVVVGETSWWEELAQRPLPQAFLR